MPILMYPDMELIPSAYTPTPAQANERCQAAYAQLLLRQQPEPGNQGIYVTGDQSVTNVECSVLWAVAHEIFSLNFLL